MLGFLNMNPNITSFMYFPKIGLFIVEVEDKKRKQWPASAWFG